jgi:hypothetical protein
LEHVDNQRSNLKAWRQNRETILLQVSSMIKPASRGVKASIDKPHSNGPKGRDNSAQGNALGFRFPRPCGLKGRLEFGPPFGEAFHLTLRKMAELRGCSHFRPLWSEGGGGESG